MITLSQTGAAKIKSKQFSGFGSRTKRLLTIKDISGMNLRISPQLLDKSCQYRKEDVKNRITS